MAAQPSLWPEERPGRVVARPPYIFVTFLVTEDGEKGHPMDALVVRIDLDGHGEPDPQTVERLHQLIRRELARKVSRR